MRATRRGFLRGALAGGATMAAAGMAAESALATPAPLRGLRGDNQLLVRLIEYERAAESAYSYLARSATLSSQAKRTFAHFLGQERTHTRLLSAALAARGEKLHAPEMGVSAAARQLERLGVSGRLQGTHHQQDAAVRLLISVEGVGQNLYYGAIERLSSPALLALATEILACEGQHWTGLSNILHPGQPGTTVPHAFVPLVGQFSG